MTSDTLSSNDTRIRQALRVMVFLMLLMGVTAALYVFFSSLVPSDKAVSKSLFTVTVPTLTPGKLETVNVGGYTLFILKPDEIQERSIVEMDSHVWDSNGAAYNEDLGAYVYWGYSTRRGTPLEILPEQLSPLIEYNKDAKWVGGYWDSLGEVSYDYSGRSIKTYERTFNGFNGIERNMITPEVFRKTSDGYVVSVIQRR